jgi:hypothetical protein
VLGELGKVLEANVKVLTMAAAMVLTALMATTGYAADQTWTGEISDSACGAKHESGAENVPPPPAPECVAACLRGGSKYVLVVGETVYQIANQDNAGLATHAGHTVKLTGELNGDTITVNTIAMP